jgi:transmembrane sensor
MKDRANETDLDALRWALLMQEAPLSPEQRQEFDQWVNADSRRQGAYVRARAALPYLDRLSAMAGKRSAPAIWHGSRRQMMAASLSAVGLLGASAWLGRDWIEKTWLESRYVSDIGQTRSVRLSDGSAMTLNTATEAIVLYSRGRREVRLVRGEALFQVVHDVARPFLVTVGALTLRALGTAFAVRRETPRNDARVTVNEGAVEITLPTTRPTDERQAPQRLAADQEALIADNHVVEVRAVSKAEASRRLAWRTGILVFDGETLRDAVAELNRYNRRQVSVADETLATRRVVGVFHTTDTATFVSAVEFTMSARSVVSPNGNIVLTNQPAMPN